MSASTRGRARVHTQTQSTIWRLGENMQVWYVVQVVRVVPGARLCGGTYPSKGGYPHIIMYTMTPIAHTSTCRCFCMCACVVCVCASIGFVCVQLAHVQLPHTLTLPANVALADCAELPTRLNRKREYLPVIRCLVHRCVLRHFCHFWCHVIRSATDGDQCIL